MIKLEAKTKLSREKVVERLKSSFGEGGLGLKITGESPECLYFEGGGGYVEANICSEKGKTRLDLTAQEWDYQVKKFISELP